MVCCPENDVVSGKMTGSRRVVTGEEIFVTVDGYGDVLVPMSHTVWRGLPTRVGDSVQITGVTDMGVYWQALQACAAPTNAET